MKLADIARPSGRQDGGAAQMELGFTKLYGC